MPTDVPEIRFFGGSSLEQFYIEKSLGPLAKRSRESEMLWTSGDFLRVAGESEGPALAKACSLLQRAENFQVSVSSRHVLLPESREFVITRWAIRRLVFCQRAEAVRQKPNVIISREFETCKGMAFTIMMSEPNG